jgi:hypothetical protein
MAHPPKPFSEIAEIKELYLLGFSTREVAAQLGLSKTRVAHFTKKLGLSRGRVEAAKPGQPHKVDSTHWRTMRQRARKIWKLAHGPIPKGYHVHHKNRDATDNRLENLELLTLAEHMSLHHRGPEYGIPVWLRPKRRAYMKAYLKNYKRPNVISS